MSKPTMVARPQPGPGLVVRTADLLMVCADSGVGADAVLKLIQQVADEGGDGVDLVRRTTDRLTAEWPAVAVGGLITGGGAAILVHGAATAEAGGAREPVHLSGPALAHRLVTGPISSLRLTLPGAGAPDPRTRLDVGVVSGAGVVAEVRSAQQRLSIRRPDPAVPFEFVLLTPGSAEPQPAPEAVDPRPLVEGVHCKNGHFNDPALRFCQVCGISMAQLTHVTRLGPRPALGVLLLDDGMTFRLDADYVIGRDPEQDPAVADGRARALRITDSGGGVSRRHLRVFLVGWTVQIVDLGSANGTFIEPPEAAAQRRLVAGEPVLIRPGSRVAFGRRWLRYESHRNP
jgi:FHA domain